MIHGNQVPTPGGEEPHFTRRQILIAAGGSVLAISLGGILSGCGGADESASAVPRSESDQSHEGGLNDPAAKLRAERIISTFENSTTEIQYGYAENLGDGRGITAGRAGFTSGTSDLLMVVDRYEKSTTIKDNPLAKFLPALKAVDGTDSTRGLDGFVTAWQNMTTVDPALKQAQDSVYDTLYFDPAMVRAKNSGVKTALGQLIILDTIIQHGEGDDPDGLPAIMQQTTKKLGVADGNEAKWLNHFLTIRRKHLEHAADPSTRKGWRESVSRVDALKTILETGKLSLEPPISWTVYGDSFELDS